MAEPIPQDVLLFLAISRDAPWAADLQEGIASALRKVARHRLVTFTRRDEAELTASIEITITHETPGASEPVPATAPDSPHLSSRLVHGVTTWAKAHPARAAVAGLVGTQVLNTVTGEVTDLTTDQLRDLVRIVVAMVEDRLG